MNYDSLNCPNCGRGPWTLFDIEYGRCPDCEEEEEEAFTCPTCGRGPWAFYEIEDNKCPLCRGKMDEYDFYD